MALTATITPIQKYDLTVAFQDANDNAAPPPGPVVWTLGDPSLGSITPTADTFGCRFSPVPAKPGIAVIKGVNPSAPNMQPVEADITISPLASKMVLTGKVV